MECKHRYIGSSDGVTCTLCGEHWTHEQYVASFAEKGQTEPSAPAPEKKKPGRPKKSAE